LLFIAVVLLVAAGAAVLAWSFADGFSAEALEARVASLGIWAPIGFVALYAIGTVAMVPGSIFDLVGGALFGPYFGSVLDLIGGTLGAGLAFIVGSQLARAWAEKRAGPRLQNIMQSVDAEGWRFVAFVRLVPIFPYNVMNYLLGLTRIPFSQYIAATVVFMAPSTVAYTWVGHAGRKALAGDTDSLPYALIALGIVAAALLLPRFVKRLRSG
jgi:uncharacterized membrane protein YdjX (TVP38/TMEM64 family)